MKETKFHNLCLCSEDHCWFLAVKVMKCTPLQISNIYAYRTFMTKVSQRVFHFLYNFVQHTFAAINIKESTNDIDTNTCILSCNVFLILDHWDGSTNLCETLHHSKWWWKSVHFFSSHFVHADGQRTVSIGICRVVHTPTIQT